MTKRREFPVDREGNIVASKVIVGCDKGRYLSGKVKEFPDRAFNWVGENRVLIQVREGPRRIRGQAFLLDEELA